MTNTPADRPASLRRPVRPAADESVDPVDYTPAEPRKPASATPEAAPAASSTPAEASAPAPSSPAPQSAPTAPAGRGRRRQELTAPFSTRLAPDVIELIDLAADQGSTIRAVIETAVRQQYGHLKAN